MWRMPVWQSAFRSCHSHVNNGQCQFSHCPPFVQDLENCGIEQICPPSSSMVFRLDPLISFCSNVWKIAWLINSMKLRATCWHKSQMISSRVLAMPESNFSRYGLTALTYAPEEMETVSSEEPFWFLRWKPIGILLPPVQVIMTQSRWAKHGDLKNFCSDFRLILFLAAECLV
jgi:hypothetical protein